MISIECCNCGATVTCDSFQKRVKASISEDGIWFEFSQRCPLCGAMTPVRALSTEVDAFPFTKCHGCVCLRADRWLCSAAFCEVRG